jgi:hypothetical protein
MKTKDSFKIIIIAAAIGLSCSSCKKKDSTTITSDDAAATADANQQQQNASDQLQVENESNQIFDDANTALTGNSVARGASLISNATIDSTMIAKGVLVITYSGLSDDGKKSRSGSIIVKLDTSANGSVIRWHTAGAVLTLTFNNYMVTRISDGKKLTFNGTHVITNKSGGLLATITENSPITHKIRANNMNLTFDDGTQRTWNAARRRIFTISGGVVSETLSGDTTVNGYNNIAMWGKTRSNNDFYVSTTTPLTANIYGGGCLFKPIGARVFYVAARTLTVTYGVDQSGTSVTSGCPYGFKLDWINVKGISKEVIVSY